MPISKWLVARLGFGVKPLVCLCTSLLQRFSKGQIACAEGPSAQCWMTKFHPPLWHQQPLLTQPEELEYHPGLPVLRGAARLTSHQD